MTTTAASTVFGTYELLENILHALPTRDILLGQRVNRDWRDVVKRSYKLQRALFIMPAGPVDRPPLMLFWDTDAPGGRKWAYERSGASMKVYKNLLLKPLHISMDEEKTGAIEARLPLSWRRVAASWRQMLLSQPPTVAGIIEWRGCVGHISGTATSAAELLAAPLSNFAKPLGRSIDGDWDWEELESNEQLEEFPVQSSS